MIKVKNKEGAIVDGELGVAQLGLDITNGVLYTSLNGTTVIQLTQPIVDTSSFLSKVTSDGAPTSTPASVGMVNHDTTNDRFYFSTGTSSSADWGKPMVTVDSTDSLENKSLLDGDNNTIDDGVISSGPATVFTVSGIGNDYDGNWYDSGELSDDHHGSTSVIYTNGTRYANDGSAGGDQGFHASLAAAKIPLNYVNSTYHARSTGGGTVAGLDSTAVEIWSGPRGTGALAGTISWP